MIENLGSKLYSGLKQDRKSDSLGSSADGTNTGITLLTGKEITWTSSGSTVTQTSITKSTASAGWTNNYAHSQSYSSGIVIVEFDPNVGQGYGSLCGFDDGTNNSTPTDITLGMAGLTSATNCNSIVSGTATDQGSGSWAAGDTMKIEYNIDSGAYVFSRNGTSFVTGTLTGGAKPSSVRVLVSNYSQNYKVTEIKLSGGGTSATANQYKLGTGAYEFDGTDDFVNLGTDSGLNLLNGGTVAMWVNTDNITDKRFAGKGSNGAWELLSETTDNKVKFRVNDGSVKNVIGTTALSDGTWYHIAGVYDKSAGEIRLYVNGTLENTTTGIGQIATISTPAYLGRNEGGNYYDGTIDDVGIWNRVLTATEIGKLANNNQVGSLTSNVASYIFAEQANSRLKFVVKRGQGSGISGWIDTGLTSSSSNWDIKFKLNVPTRSVASNNMAYFGFSSTTTNQDSDYSSPSGNIIGYYINLRSSGETAAHGAMNIQAGNTYSYNLINDANSLQFSDSSTAYTKWIKIVKNGNTANMTIHDSESDADNNILTSGSDTATGTNSTAGAFTNLRYLKWYNVAGGSTDEATIYFSDLKLYDDTTSTSGTPTKNYPFVDGDAQLVSSLTNKSELKAYYSMDSTSLGLTPTKSNSNFGSWTTTGSQVTESSNVISFDITTRTSTHICSQDLGSALSDDKWVLRGKLNYTTLTGGGGSTVYFEVGVGSSATATIHNDGVNLDFIGLQQRLANDANGWGLVGYDSSGSLDNPESPEMDTDPNTSTTYYFEIKRTADNAMSIGLYDSSSYDTLITGIPIETKTIATSITGLRYLRISNAQAGSESSTGNVIEGTISDLKVYDGVSSVDGCKNDFSATSDLEALSGVRTSSIFQQTDDTPTYWWYNGTSWLLDGTTKVISPESDYASTSGWTDVDTGGDIAIDTTNKGVTYTDVNVGDSGIGKSLGTTLSNSKWLVQFTFQIADWNTNDAGLVSLTSDHTQGFKVSGLKTINFMPQGTPLGGNSPSPSYNRFVLMSGQTNSYAEKASPNDKFVANTQYWVDMYRDGSNIKCKVYTNSGRTGTPHWESDNLPIGTNLDGLTGIQHWNENTADIDIGTGWIREITVYNGVTEKPE